MMTSLPGRLRERVLAPHPREVTFSRRGFTATSNRARHRLEGIGLAFLSGLGPGLAADEVAGLNDELLRVDPDLRGFAFEGAAMGLAVADALSVPRRDLLGEFGSGPGAVHIYMVHVGMGWAWARLPGPLRRRVTSVDPLLRWLILDGFGFHHAYFRTARYVPGDGPVIRPTWPDPTGYAPRAVDQGIGRALWFVGGADVRRVARLVQAYPAPRREDLWSGVGLAATYAGGAGESELTLLARLSGGHRGALAQGAAFAAKARLRAGLVTPETVDAVGALCGCGVAAAALVTDEAREGLSDREGPSDDVRRLPAYELWRQRIQSRYSPFSKGSCAERAAE